MMMGLGWEKPTRSKPLCNPLILVLLLLLFSLLFMQSFLLFYIYNIIKERVSGLSGLKEVSP